MSIRRRDVALIVAIVAINTAFALSDRAATFWGDVSESLGTSTSTVAEVVTSSGVTTSQGDWAVHLLLWATSSAVVVFVFGRPRLFIAVILGFVAVSGALELLQNVVTIHRAAQWTDVAGNLVGMCAGIAAGTIALWCTSRLRPRDSLWRAHSAS